MFEYHPISAKDQARLHQFGTRSLQASSLDICCTREASGKEILVADVEELNKFGRVRHPCSETPCEGGSDAEKR